MLTELSTFKSMIAPRLYESETIKNILLGADHQTVYPTKDAVTAALDQHIFPHLSINHLTLGTGTYLFYETHIPQATSSLKTCNITVYALSQGDILNTGSGTFEYEGNRIDILAQAVEEVILNNETIRTFGIGKMELKSVMIYNCKPDIYGKILEFSVPNFR